MASDTLQVYKKVLCILHTPPPVHGAALVGKYIQSSRTFNSCFNINYINLSTSSTLNKIGKGGIRKLLSLVKIQIQILNALVRNHYDICYVTLTARGAGFYKDFLIVMILKLFRKKIIYHFHNKGVSSSHFNRLNDLLYRQVFKKAKVILLSEHLYPDIEKYVSKNDVYFCANGIPFNSPSVSPQSSNDNHPCRLLFLSNMMETKGVFVLLEACEILRNKSLSYECNFVGDWSDISNQSFHYELKKRNLTQHVFAHGKKFDTDKHAFFTKSNIFIHPTLNDCFPLVILEAMQFGLPIISTKEGGIPDIVMDGETGFLVPHKDSIALADKIELLINQPALRKEMGEAGKKRYQDYFTLEKFENNLVHILKSAIEA